MRPMPSNWLRCGEKQVDGSSLISSTSTHVTKSNTAKASFTLESICTGRQPFRCIRIARGSHIDGDICSHATGLLRVTLTWAAAPVPQGQSQGVHGLARLAVHLRLLNIAVVQPINQGKWASPQSTTVWDSNRFSCQGGMKESHHT